LPPLPVPALQTRLFLDRVRALHKRPPDTGKVLPPFLVMNKAADFPGGRGNVCAVRGRLFSRVDSSRDPCAWFLMPRSRHSWRGAGAIDRRKWGSSVGRDGHGRRKQSEDAFPSRPPNILATTGTRSHFSATSELNKYFDFDLSYKFFDYARTCHRKPTVR
jgi:hypothetical protein